MSTADHQGRQPAPRGGFALPLRLPQFVSGHRFLAASSAIVGASVAGGLVRRIFGAPQGAEEPWPEESFGDRRAFRGPKGTRIFSERFAGRSETVLFTHGWCLNESVWLHQKQRLARGSLSVVTWDLPGHGRSTAPRSGSVTLDLLVDSLARTVDETTETGSGIVLVGHSLGGIITLRYVAANPETARRRIRGMVLISTPMTHVTRSVAGGWPGSLVESWILGTAMHLVVGSRGVDRVLETDAGRPGSDSLSYHIVRSGFGRTASPPHIRLVRDAIASVPRDVRLQTFRAMSGYDIRGSLRDIEVPALVMFGTKDRLVNPAETRTLGQRLPKSTTLEFPGAGHALFLENVATFNSSLSTFLRARLRPRREPAGPAKPSDGPSYRAK